jgi:hypothetical protein
MAAAPGTGWYRDRDWNTGPERYSAWFADARDGILYFGLSPFWTLWWESGGDPRRDLEAAGEQLIGRFDLRARAFLVPLRVRAAAEGARSSVWDVLAHSSGRIYYTTFFEEMGWIAAEGEAQQRFAHLGGGLNELVEGPGGSIYVTRYTEPGSVISIEPDGALRWETRLEPHVAPKSVAVDPTSGEVWINTDTKAPDGSIAHETIRLSAQGEVLEARSADGAELHFAAFSSAGEGWFAEARGEWLWLRYEPPRGARRELRLARLDPIDFAQDIEPGPGSAVVALWSRRAFEVRAGDAGLVAREVRFRVPPECEPPHPSLTYTAVAWQGELFATLFCGPVVLRAPLPE